MPYLGLETSSDWNDRVSLTSSGRKAWHFPHLLFVDRSASFRDDLCGGVTQRTVSLAFEATRAKASIYWWEPVRRAVLKFAGMSQDVLDIGVRFSGEKRQMGSDVVITYISRQGWRRRLIEEDHIELVNQLTDLCARKKWELNVVKPERLSQDEQLALAARTTVCLVLFLKN